MGEICDFQEPGESCFSSQGVALLLFGIPQVLIPLAVLVQIVCSLLQNTTLSLLESTTSGWQSGSCILNRTWLLAGSLPGFFLPCSGERGEGRFSLFKPGLLCDVTPQSLTLNHPNQINSKGFAVSPHWVVPSPSTGSTPDFQLSEDGKRISSISISAAFWQFAVRMCHSCCSWVAATLRVTETSALGLSRGWSHSQR